eukprot:m.199850 g.199850  ORF g.199850 m.199850 type:complete len:814 (-) comp17045_c0_seq2:91-2532(-)
MLRVIVIALGCLAVTHAIDCNHHGVYYQEEASLGVTACACYQCYGGDQCQTLLPNCSLETRVAEAAMFETWFDQVQADLSITIGPDYHLSYLKAPRTFPPNADPSQYDEISLLLNASIHRLHSLVKNVDTTGMTLVLGAGGVQLIDAALYALTQRDNKQTYMHVYTQSPFYPHFEQASGINPLTNFTRVMDGINPSSVIEILTTPNNPDNRAKEPVVKGSSAQITDLVYDWPHYTPTTSARADDLMIFSLSKLSGYAASRLGWAFVRDPDVVATMSKYMFLQSTAPAVESQLRGVKVLNAIADNYHGDMDFFTTTHTLLTERWRRLRSIFSSQKRFELAGEDGGLFMWVQCLHADDQKDCAAPFGTVGITTETGVAYGSDTSHVRICMGHHNSTFELLTARLQQLMTQSSLTAVELRRASTLIPRESHQAPAYVAMTTKLNTHLPKYTYDRHQLHDCEALTVEELHATEAELAAKQSARLQQVYTKVADPRRLAFPPNLERQHALEVAVAATSSESHQTVQSGLCHRIVMQYVHQVPARHLKEMPPLNLPRLPVEDVQRLNPQAIHPTAQAVLDNATQCVKCHIADDSPVVDTMVIQPPAPGQSPPIVPPWPAEFDVRFGLFINTSEQVLRNSSSHMYFSHDFPSMHIQHSQCPKHFLPQIPDIESACNLTFHHDGLWIIWPNEDTNTAQPHCCQVIKANMTANLGLNELGGFDYLGMTNTTDFSGHVVEAEVWTNGPKFPISPGFRIMIDPSSNEDVHYHNGGSFGLEWWLQPRNIATQPVSLFQLPDTPECEAMCQPGTEAILNHLPLPRV